MQVPVEEQIRPAPHSGFETQATHRPLVQARFPHSAEVVHVPPGRATQRPAIHCSDAAQSASIVQAGGTTQTPLVHVPPPGHCASVVHPPTGVTMSGARSWFASAGTHVPSCPMSRSPAPALTDRKKRFASQVVVNPTTFRFTLPCK